MAWKKLLGFESLDWYTCWPLRHFGNDMFYANHVAHFEKAILCGRDSSDDVTI